MAEIRRQAYNIEESERERRTAMIDWIDEQIPLLPIKNSTRERYYVLSRRMREYGKMLAWHDLTTENIYSFNTWLHNIKKPQSNGDVQAGAELESISEAGVYNYHRTLRAMLTRAVRFGLIENNPYDKVRGEFRKGIKENVEYLTEEEIAAVESLHPMPGTQVAMARDMFVFQMYTGLSYSDARAFDINAYKKVKGKWVAIGTRIKTGTPYVSQLLPQAVDVLERYGWQTPNIGNVQYNLSLKAIQQALGIKTKMHSHLARHTFATRALALGVSIENVSAMLGHTNITQTQRYAKVLAESVHNDYELLREAIEKKK